MNEKIDTKRSNRIYSHLMDWFNRNKRDLPWRTTPREAYRVWISEIMLQQTQVETAVPYFEAWMKRWPSVKDLAKASENQVLKAWEGLGYYSRAGNILKTARLLNRDYGGKLPAEYKELLKLPGIGPYTGAAIASHTSGQAVGAVDANVLRVLSRLNQAEWTAGDASSLKKCQKYLSRFMKELKKNHSKSEPELTFGLFNEALIELGALICRAKTASCDLCPLKEDCAALIHDNVYDFPLPKEKVSRKEEFYSLLILYREDIKRFAAEQRPSEGLLGGLWQFPMLEGLRETQEIRIYLEDKDYSISSLHGLKPYRHVFSHLIWNIKPFTAVLRSSARQSQVDSFILREEPDPYKWLPADELMELAFSSSMTGLRELVVNEGFYLD